MKIGCAIGLAATSLLLSNMPAQAQDQPNIYIGIKGDVASPVDSDVTGAANGKVEYGFSSGAGVAVGWQPEMFDRKEGDLRVELEGAYHAFGLDKVRGNTDPSGDLKATALMANLYYDWHIHTSFSPYVGVGVGQAQMKFGTDQGLGNNDDSDNVTAWQAMAGVSYTNPSVPNVTWSLGYKFIDFDQPSFSSSSGDIKLNPVREHAAELGVNYHF
jgi:opacity protein-like surface antigen